MNQRLRTALTAALLLAVRGTAPGQGESAVPFLLLPVSPETNGMGAVTSAFLSAHPMAPASNPAQLGLFSLANAFSAGIYLQETNTSPWIALDLPRYHAFAINAGVNLQTSTGLPLGVGLGYSRIRVELGEFAVTVPGGPQPIGTVRAYEVADNLSLAIGIDSGVRIGAGASIKLINSHLGAFASGGGVSEAAASATGYDIAVLLSIPIARLASSAGAKLDVPSLHIAPLLDLTVGFTKNNLGDRITYVDPAQADPLPRQASLGAGIEAGVVSTLLPDSWKVLSAGLYREAADLLVLRHADGSWEYTGGVGDVDFIDNVIAGKGSSTITQRKGWQIDIAEVLAFRGGSVTEPGRALATTGFALRLGGLFKALAALAREEQGSWIDFLSSSVDVRYDASEVKYQPGGRTVSYSSLCVVLTRIPF